MTFNFDIYDIFFKVFRLTHWSPIVSFINVFSTKNKQVVHLKANHYTKQFVNFEYTHF